MRIRTETKPCNNVNIVSFDDGVSVVAVFVLSRAICMVVRTMADPIVRIDTAVLDNMYGKQFCIT